MSNTVKYIEVSKLKLNDDNPRIIKDSKFEELCKSIKEFPEMFALRPVIVNKDNVIIGGNMRFRASLEIGLKKVPVLVADMSDKKQREFVIKDNLSSGFWDWDTLANNWDNLELSEWGMETFMFGADTGALNLDERISLEEELKEPKVTTDGYVKFEIIISEDDKTGLINLISKIKEEDEISSADAFMKIVKSYKI